MSDPLQPWLPFTSLPEDLADETFVTEMWQRGYWPVDIVGSDEIAWVRPEPPPVAPTEPDDFIPETEEPDDA